MAKTWPATVAAGAVALTMLSLSSTAAWAAPPPAGSLSPGAPVQALRGGSASSGPSRHGNALSENFEEFPLGSTWAEGSTHGPWFAKYAGFGSISVVNDGSQVL